MKSNPSVRFEPVDGIRQSPVNGSVLGGFGGGDVSVMSASCEDAVALDRHSDSGLQIRPSEPGSKHREETSPKSRSVALHQDAAELIKQAQRRTGLQDFGQPGVEEPLSVLTNSLAEEAGLHRLGQFLANVHLRDLLETRLRLVDAWNQSLGLNAVRVKQPIFVTGMPRSGSTFLHELLSLDSANRAPRVWEVMYPLRQSGSALNGDLGRIWRAETNLWWFRRLAPQADSVYPMRARTPHECVAIHSYTMLSQEFVSSFHVPHYEAYLDAADLVPTYCWEKRFLQSLQLRDSDRRWVLKSPDHVRSLEALWQVFPDAVVIQTHRHPLETLVSSSHLTEVLRGMFSRSQTRQEIGRREAQIMADNMTRIMNFRDAHPELADRFIDVQYGDLVSDPVATLTKVYERTGAVLSEDTTERVRKLASSRGRYAHQRNGHPALGELGLDPRIEAERFDRYCARFTISPTKAR